jgi:hypothetical protein
VAETFGPVLRARTLTKGSGNVVVAVDGEPAKKKQMRKLVLLVLTRPFRILAEPLVFFTDLFLCYQYIIFFLYFESYPVIFQGAFISHQPHLFPFARAIC